MHIEIICTGDEVLTGKIVNTNFSYITQKLEDVGLSVQWETTVGDDRETLLRAFQLAGERADAVIVNGGLGPTVDDLSQEIAAQAAGVDLVLNEEWLARMEDFFQRRSRVMPPNNRKQAMLPDHRRGASTTRSAPPAASRSTSAGRASSSPPACRASCAACSRSRSSRGCSPRAACRRPSS